MKYVPTLLITLWLAGVAMASTDPVTLTIDLGQKRVTSTNVIAIRETVPVRLVNIGGADPSNLVLRITDNAGVTYALTDGFAASDPITVVRYGVTSVLASAVGSVDLNTAEFAAFYTNRPPDFARPFTLGVWDTGRNRLLANDRINVRNNPYMPGMPGPSPIGVYYLSIDPGSAPMDGYIVQYSGGVWVPVDPAATFAILSSNLWMTLAGKAESNLVWSTFAKIEDLPPLFDPAALESNINAVAASIPDITNLATTDQVAAVQGLIPDVSGYATTDEVAAVTSNYLPLSGGKLGGPLYPTSISAGTNSAMTIDGGYNTSGENDFYIKGSVNPGGGVGRIKFDASTLTAVTDKDLKLQGGYSVFQGKDLVLEGGGAGGSGPRGKVALVGGVTLRDGAHNPSRLWLSTNSYLTASANDTSLFFVTLSPPETNDMALAASTYLPRSYGLQQGATNNYWHADFENGFSFVAGWGRSIALEDGTIDGGFSFLGPGYVFDEITVGDRTWTNLPDISSLATTDQVAAVQALIPDVSPFLKGNSIGSFTNLPLASLVQTASNRWEFGGWTVVGTYTNGMISLTETNAHYIQTPPFAAGVSEIGGSYLYGIGATALDVDYYTEAGGWVSNYVSQRAVYTGYMGISAALAGSTSNALQPSLRLRYAGFLVPPLGGDSVAGGIYLTNLAIRGWSQSAYVGQTNDNAGMLALVDDNITADARAAVNQRTLDSTRSQLQNAIDGIDPSLAGVDLNYNPLRFNHLWRARQTNETLEFAFDGAPMFELTGGGTVTPQIVAMSMSGPTVTVVVASATAWRPWLEYTTNLFTGWELAATNLYTSTWPDLVNGTYTLGYTSIYPQAYYRVVATSTNATDGYAKFYVPLQADASAMTDFPNYLARTSALSAYLRLAGGTITGNITIGPADNPLKITKNYSGGVAIDVAITNSTAGARGIVINDGSDAGAYEYLSLRRRGSTQYSFSLTQATFNVSVVSTSRVQGASLGIGTNTLSESGGRLAFNGANLATDAMLSNATANAQTPVTVSTSGALTINLGAKPLHAFLQVGAITNIVLSYDTNKVTFAEVLLYANGSAITWPTNNVTWKPHLPDAASNKWQSILFRSHRGKVQAAYVESYD